jgi:flagellar biogenesis protein FliO
MLFFGGVWVARNWQRLVPRASSPADLQVLEVKSLGARQNLVVVGYRGQRMLLAAAPTGVTLLTHLPESEPTGSAEAIATTTAVNGRTQVSGTDFVGAFREVLARRA